MSRQDTSIYVRSQQSGNITENEALRKGVKGVAEGAVKGTLAGGVLGFGLLTPITAPIGAVVGATIGGIGGVVEGGKREHQKGTIGKEVEAPTFWNGEMFTAAALATVTGVATGGFGFIPAVAAIGGTVLAGKMGEKRMEAEYTAAKQEVAADQVRSAQSLQAMNMAASHQMGGMNTISAEEYAQLQQAQQNRGVHGRFTQAALQQEQQLGIPGVAVR